MKQLALALFVAFSYSSLAHADDASSGCGIGWQVAREQTLLSSSARALTNATFLNTVAMTFGTSGCAKHKIVLREKAALHYAEANYHNLMMDFAMGRGEYADSLAGLLGCKDNQLFRASMQSHYSQIFPALATPGEVLSHVRTAISSDPSLRADCSAAI